MNNRAIFCVVAVGLFGGLTFPSGVADTNLSVSDNGHYLLRDGKPFLWIGDTAWQLPVKLKREDVNFYLDDRRARGFTVIQIVAYMNSPNAPNVYGHRPFQGGEKLDPGRPLTERGGSLDEPNDFWDHFDFVVAATKKRDLQLAVLPCWGGSYINGLNGNGSKIIFDVPKAQAYGEFLGARYGNEPHLIWVLGGDVGATTGPKKIFSDKRPEYRAMAEGLAKGASGAPAKWNEPHAAWDKLFITYHPFGGPPAESSSLWFHDDPWCDFHFVQTHRYLNQPYATMLRDYHLPHPKPTVQSEPAYEGIHAEDGTAPPPRPKLRSVDALQMRRQFWQSYFGGACGFTLGLDNDASTQSTGPLWRFIPQWKELLATPSTLSVCEGGRKILGRHAWWKWVPDQAVIDDDFGDKDLTFAAVRSSDNHELLIYYPMNSNKKIKLSIIGTTRCRAKWIHTQDGAETPVGEFDTDQTAMFKPPSDWPDALLLIEKK